jgi:hypothetical protein
MCSLSTDLTRYVHTQYLELCYFNIAYSNGLHSALQDSFGLEQYIIDREGFFQKSADLLYFFVFYLTPPLAYSFYFLFHTHLVKVIQLDMMNQLVLSQMCMCLMNL